MRKLGVKFELGISDGLLATLGVRPMLMERRIKIRKMWKFESEIHRPYEVIKHVGFVAYHLALPPNLVGIHNVFHVSMFERYRSDPSHMLQEKLVELKENLSYEEEPVAILAKDQKVLRNKVIP